MLPEQELWLQGLRAGQRMRFRPLGGSMIPFIRQEDIVSIYPGQGCRLGDIVLWQAGETLVLHRVVAKRQGLIITKGDSLSQLDAAVAPQQIRGRALLLERGGRVWRLHTFRQRWLGLAFSLTVPLIPGLMALLASIKRGVQAVPGQAVPVDYQEING